MRKLLKILGIAALAGCMVSSEAAFAFRGGFRGAGFHGYRGGFHGSAFRGGNQVWAGRWGGARPGWGGARWAGGRYGYYRPGWGVAATAAGLAATSPYWGGTYYGGAYNGGTACGPYAYYDPNYGCVPYQQ